VRLLDIAINEYTFALDAVELKQVPLSPSLSLSLLPSLPLSIPPLHSSSPFLLSIPPLHPSSLPPPLSLSLLSLLSLSLSLSL
jgi:hypothetical protein